MKIDDIELPNDNELLSDDAASDDVLHGDDADKANELPDDAVMDASSYDAEVSEDDFYDELDEGIDNYFQNLRKKK